MKRYVECGGKLIVTGDTNAYDEWGNKRRGNVLEGIKGLSRLEGEPVLKWVRTRDRDAAPSLFVSPCWAAGGKLRRVSRPENGVISLNRGWNIRAARLGVSGAKLRIDTRRRIILPEIETHDVLILDV